MYPIPTHLSHLISPQGEETYINQTKTINLKVPDHEVAKVNLIDDLNS
jgi:hypothetical protein